MISFIIGVILGYFFCQLLRAVDEENKWKKWSEEDFDQYQKEERKEFLSYKEIQEELGDGSL